MRQTLGASGPWLVAVSFALYSSQWLAVIGFLPTVVAQAGLGAAATAVLTALAAAANIVGNVASGRLLQRGVPPTRLLAVGFAVMALAATAAFAGLGAGDGASGRAAPVAAPTDGLVAGVPGVTAGGATGGATGGAAAHVGPLPGRTASPTGAPDAGPAARAESLWRYAAVLVFSGVGGIIPGTLFSLAVRLAPSPATLATTVGWVQQWSSLGQFAGPPAVAWAASRLGGWQATPLVTVLCAGLGLLLTLPLARRLAR